METFAFILFAALGLAELLFCVFQMDIAERAVRVLIIPALMFYYLCSTLRQTDIFIFIALVFEAASFILGAYKKIPSAYSFIAGLVFTALMAFSFYRSGVWALAAPHFTFTVFLVHITAVSIIIIKAYPLLTYPQLLRSSAELIFTAAFSSCAIVGAIYSMTLRTGLLALGGFMCFVYMVSRIIYENSQHRKKLGAFQTMLLYLLSRALLVFAAQLPA